MYFLLVFAFLCIHSYRYDKQRNILMEIEELDRFMRYEL